MTYSKDAYEQYFINTSRGEGGTIPTVKVEYNEVIYTHGDHEHTAYYKVLYDKKRDVIQCYFKETSDISQWRANFEFWEDYYDSFEYQGKKIQLRVANGWNKMYKALKHHVRDDFKDLYEKHPNSEVEIIGWSLGSGQAQLCAQDLFYNFGVKAHVFTYGSVKPWYKTNKDSIEYLKNCYKECYNFSEVNDIVTYQPPFSRYFMFNKIKVRSKHFCITHLFRPDIYHCCYWKSDLYKCIS